MFFCFFSFGITRIWRYLQDYLLGFLLREGGFVRGCLGRPQGFVASFLWLGGGILVWHKDLSETYVFYG